MSGSRRGGRGRGGVRLFFGLAATAFLVVWLARTSGEVDWKARAERLFAERDFGNAIEAATRKLRENTEDADMLWCRARCYRELHMPRRALDDIERALELRPGSLPFLAFRAALQGQLGDHEGAIATLDEARENAPRQVQPILLATSARMRYFRFLQERLLRRLLSTHPDPTAVEPALTEFLAARRDAEEPRARLLDPLASERLRDETAHDLDRMRVLLYEADALLGDIRRRRIAAPTAALTRAEIDFKLGRLLRAKEEIQTLLRRSLVPSTRRRALELLRDLCERLSLPSLRSKVSWKLVELAGGPKEAPLRRLADAYEADFLAAEADASLREDFLARVDEYLSEPGNRDLRTLGWRGVAALEWEDDVDGALSRLSEIYQALRLQRRRDPSLSEPTRAFRFMLALLEAYLRSGQPGRGLEVANALLGLAPENPALLERRARILETLDRPDRAADDLLRAMRKLPRDEELFRHWIDVANRVEDASGRTPPELAHEALERFRAARSSYRARLEQEGDRESVLRKIRRPGREFQQAVAQIGGLAARMADQPVIAWHLAEEFGRSGDLVESRNFLFEAWAMEPDVLPFLFRLGQYRYALGLFSSAARDFETIWARDPTDLDAARFALRAHRRAGEYAAARRLVETALDRAPEAAGWAIAAEWEILQGRPQAALRMTRLHEHAAPPKVVWRLRGLAEVAAGRLARASSALARALELRPEDPELLLAQAETRARLGKRELLAQTLELWNLAPRIQPVEDLEESLDRVASSGRPRHAAQLARGLLRRLPEEAALRFEERAAALDFRAGDPHALEALRDAPGGTTRLSDDFVRLAFGHTLLAEGPEAAARFLVRARRFTAHAPFAVLPTAAAFSLTPFSVEHETYLARFARIESGTELDEEQAILWTLARRGVDIDVDPGPLVPPDLEREVRFLSEEIDDTAAERYVRYLLLRFAGPDFAVAARREAETLLRDEPRCQFAARRMAESVAEREGAEAAVQYLVPFERVVPEDGLTLDLLARLLRRTSAPAVRLAPFVETARRLHPDRLETRLLAAEAAVRAGQGRLALGLLQAAMERHGFALPLVEALAGLARRFGYEDAAGRVVASLREGTELSEDLRSFLLARYEDPAAHVTEALALLPRLLARAPHDAELALPLAARLADREANDALERLARGVAADLPSLPDAAERVPALLKLAARLARSRLDDAVALLLDTAVAADPSSVAARRARAASLTAGQTPGAAIPDLRVLSVLAPANPVFVLDYGTVLLEERTDLSAGFQRVLERADELASDNARVAYLRGRWAFGRDELDEACRQYRRALALDPGLYDARYHLGVALCLKGDEAAAREAFAGLPARYPFRPRVDSLLAEP